MSLYGEHSTEEQKEFSLEEVEIATPGRLN